MRNPAKPTLTMFPKSLSALLSLLALLALPVRAAEPVPDKLVVLTFDDSVSSQYTVVRPLLKKYGFGATFFITEGFSFVTNKKDYMTWEQIAELHKDGFEIGNHTRDHFGVNPKNVDQLREQLAAINDRCAAHGIPKPVSFGYPGNSIAREALPVLAEMGIRFARRGGSPEYPYEKGGGIAFEPGQDHPLLIPTAGDARPTWTLDNFKKAVALAGKGRIAVLQFHGAPDLDHPWVNTPPERFAEYMKFLAEGGYKVVALRDLEKYTVGLATPTDPFAIMEKRKAEIAKGQPAP